MHDNKQFVYRFNKKKMKDASLMCVGGETENIEWKLKKKNNLQVY